MNFLIIDAWNREMQELGLLKYQMANGKFAWYYPCSESLSEYQDYRDVDGKNKKKLLVGRSAKNDVFWHYAIEPKVQYGLNPRVSLIPHVIFTTDGNRPLESKNKMHALRRGFCKMWWNDRWRGLMLAYICRIESSNKNIQLKVGNNLKIDISPTPIFLESQYSLVETVSDTNDLIIDVAVDLDSGEHNEAQ